MNRQQELKDGASGRICRRPEPTPVSCDDRTTDGQPHTQAFGLGRMEGFEKWIETLEIESRARISDCNQHVSPFILGQVLVLERLSFQFTKLEGIWFTRRELTSFPGAYPELSRTLAGSSHGFDGVDQEIEHHLLQLDSISQDERQVIGELGLK